MVPDSVPRDRVSPVATAFNASSALTAEPSRNLPKRGNFVEYSSVIDDEACPQPIMGDCQEDDFAPGGRSPRAEASVVTGKAPPKRHGNVAMR